MGAQTLFEGQIWSCEGTHGPALPSDIFEGWN